MKHLMKVLGCVLVLCFLLVPFQGFGADVKKAEPSEKIQTKMCCPVCYKIVEEGTVPIKSEYKDMVYHFDCEKCKEEFDKDPDKFIKLCKEEKDKCNKKVAYYVCPNTGCESKSDKPGKCPKCGSELKKMEEHVVCCMKKHEKTPVEHETTKKPGEKK